MSCQGGDRTPAFRVTAGRLAARLPGIVGAVDGIRTRILRLDRPALEPIELRQQVIEGAVSGSDDDVCVVVKVQVSGTGIPGG